MKCFIPIFTESTTAPRNEMRLVRIIPVAMRLAETDVPLEQCCIGKVGAKPHHSMFHIEECNDGAFRMCREVDVALLDAADKHEMDVH